MYLMELTDLITGQSKVAEFPGDYDEAAEYLWEDGNYACDGNRILFLDPSREGEDWISCASRRIEARHVDEAEK